MEVIFVIVVVTGVVFAASKLQEKPRQLQLAARTVGRIRHLRTGEYPSSCSWCKSTTIARKLFMFERDAEGWRSADVMGELQRCADDQVEGYAALLANDHPRWRRICTERCAKELSASEHVAIADKFVSCEYCSVRRPLALAHCPNCGAMRKSA